MKANCQRLRGSGNSGLTPPPPRTGMRWKSRSCTSLFLIVARYRIFFSRGCIPVHHSSRHHVSPESSTLGGVPATAVAATRRTLGMQC